MLAISLLHATYLNPSGPLRVRDTWLSRADTPDKIEYIVAMDESDEFALRQTEGILRAINRPQDSLSTAVQNWNSAARLAKGDVLFVISDDLEPPQGWDTQLEILLAGRNPATQDYAVKIQDSPNDADTTLRHPVISRKFYDKLGLFDPSFRGVFCDNDITLRALLASQIVDGRSICFSHVHPHFDREVQESVSQQRINRAEEYVFGREIFNRKYSPFHRGLNLNTLTLPTENARLDVGTRARRIGIKLKRTSLRVQP